LTQASVVDLRDAVSAGSAKYPSLGNPEEGINTRTSIDRMCREKSEGAPFYFFYYLYYDGD
jgi:hypothetical protein